MEKLLVCRKMKKAEDGKEKPIIFCYRQVERKGEDGSVTWVDEINPATGKSTSVTVHLTEHFKNEHPLESVPFPCYMTVDMARRIEVINSEGEKKEVNACYLTIDKTQDGKARLDKYGKRHPICIINSVVEISEAPHREITWDNVADIE